MLTTGMTTSTATTASANKVRPQRTQAGSCWALRTLARVMVCGLCRTASVLIAHAPAFQQIDEHQHGERNDQQYDGDRRGLAVGELLQARDDQDGSDLGFVGHVSRDEDHRTVLADTARKGQGETSDERWIKGGQDDIAKRLP